MMAKNINEGKVVYDEIVLVYNNERARVFRGVKVKLHSIIVFAVVSRCEKKASNKRKKVTMK